METAKRKRIYQIIEAAEKGDKLSAVYDFYMMALIVVSLVPLAFKTETTALRVVDGVCVILFIVDYLLRWATADYKYDSRSAVSFIMYPFSLMAVVDLLSILPSLMALNRGLRVLRMMRTFRLLRVLRVLRLFKALRVLRVFKFARYSKNMQILGNVFRRSKGPLIAVGTMAGAYILISALIIINVEPTSFRSFFEALYWATVSLTTMGYGDIYPVTAAGRLVTMVSSLFGVAIVALPAGIITAGYMSEINKETDRYDGEEKDDKK